MQQLDDCGQRIARLEENHKAMQDALSKHVDASAEKMDKLSDTLAEMKARVFGAILAGAVIVSLVSIAGTVVAVYAALSR